MIIGIDSAINWLETNKTPYWYVRNGSSEKASLMFSAKDADDESPIALVDSVSKLRKCLEMLSQGNYVLQAWESPGQKKNWKETRFQITSGSIGMSGAPMYSSSMPSPVQDVQKMIEEALEKERTKNKIETLTAEKTALEKKIKELEAEKDSWQYRVGNRFDQVFGDISGLLTQKNINNSQSVGNAQDDSERIAQLMENWASIDSDFESVLKGIVNLAQTNPSKYQMGKNLLK